MADGYFACINDSNFGVHQDFFTVAWRINVIRGFVGTPKDVGKGSSVPPGTHVTINFTPAALVLEGGPSDCSDRSLNRGDLLSKKLRTAAANRIQIRISFDSRSKIVTDLQLLYSQRCP